MTDRRLHGLNVRLRHLTIKLRSLYRPCAGGNEQFVLAGCLRELEEVLDALDALEEEEE